jgi:heme oxygenase-like protein
METASGRLRRKIELIDGPFAVVSSTLFRHPRLDELWPEYAIRTHWIIRATVPLMEDAETRARTQADDPVAAGLAAFLAEHIEKERGHDDWVLEDLELLGVERSAVLARVPSSTVASLVGSHYYWIRHCHPVAVLGYAAVMEGHPPSPELIDRLVARSGYPRAAFRAFAEHGELDLHHRADLYDAIDGLPLTPAHESLMGLAAMTTVELLTRSLEEIVEDAA